MTRARGASWVFTATAVATLVLFGSSPASTLESTAASDPAATLTTPATPESKLIAAWRTGDADVGLRMAARAGLSGVERMLASPSRPAAHAALWITPRLDAPWSLLPALAAQAEGRDRIRAVVAARAATTIGRRWTAFSGGDEDEPLFESTAARFAVLAADAGATADVRVASLMAASALDAAIIPPRKRSELLARLLGDTDPAVRLAAAETAPADLAALMAATRDPSISVSRAAVATIAAAHAPGGLPDALLASADMAATWANDTTLPLAERARAMRVLRAAGRKVDHDVVRRMSRDKKLPKVLRRTATELLKRWKPVRR